MRLPDLHMVGEDDDNRRQSKCHLLDCWFLMNWIEEVLGSQPIILDLTDLLLFV